jgi:L-alanine-DL-glutamate epimerase-like enolase superfamily enzyme
MARREARAVEKKPKLDPAVAARELAAHRIARMEHRGIRDRYPRFVGRNSRGRPAGRGGGYRIRTITTDKGATGWGMSHLPPEKVKHLEGARIGDIYDMGRGPAEEAYGIQIPLHDLVANILGVSVAALLGGKGPDRVPIYSGAVYFDDLEPPNKPRGVAGVLASCQQDYDTGYRAFKLKIGRGAKWMTGEPGIQRDIEITRAVREKFPDCKILVDANNGYAVDNFLRYVSGVADCDLYSIEEPFWEDREPLLKLRDHMAKVGCKALIMEGEMRRERAEQPWKYGGYSRRHVENLLALAREKLVHILNLDLGIVGFSRWRLVMPELAKEGILTSPHTWAWIPRPHYVAQLAGGVGNVCIIEGIPGTTPGVDYSAYTFDKAGNYVLPNATGFGLKLKS